MDNLGNLSGLLGPILSDPETMSKLRDIASGLGLGDKIPGGEGGGDAGPEDPADAGQPGDPVVVGEGGVDTGGIIPPEMTKMLSRAAPMLAEKETDAARLLVSLEPFLQDHRRRKLREALQIMRLLRVMSVMIPEGSLPLKL
ncbi:MAG: hypothetical protein FWE86_03770 [Oscillospiraceae bacterium]|nr:hypothetical protein [Oscillospiraceae bacterium]